MKGHSIEKIEKYGCFDDMLFFSSEPYSMGKVRFLYSLIIDEERILHSDSVFYDYDPVEEPGLQEVIEHVMHVLEVDQEIAVKLLDNSVIADIDDVEVAMDRGEAGWFIQAQQGHMGRALGYEAVAAQDEQGVVFIVPMLGREKDLTIERTFD